MKWKILTFFVLQNVVMLLIYHNTFVAFTFTIPERKTKKKTFISEGLSEIWIKDPQQRPKGHSNPRKMSIYHVSSDRNSLDNLGGCLIKFIFSKKATKIYFICNCLVMSSTIKIFKFLNQCFTWLRCWKSVSNSQNLLDGSTAVLLETLFQDRSCAKHWFKHFSTLAVTFFSQNSSGKIFSN